jgi:GPH family glycoside/pentoside/hexuronide:cation symporter
MGVISPNSLERISLSTYRFFLAFGGAIIVLGCTLPLVKFFGKGDQVVGFQFTMGLYAILAIILFLITFFTTRERVHPPKDQDSSLKKDLTDLLHNRPWLVLFVIGIFTLTFIAIRGASIMYYFKYYVGNEDLAGLFMPLGMAGVIVGVSMTEILSKKFGKRRLYMVLMGITSLLTILFYFVPKDQIVLIFIVHILISMVMGPTSPLLWAMYADTADYSEWKRGRRATGLVFSAATFAQKFGLAIGSAMAGWLLAYFGFKANIEQTVATQNGIRLMMSIIPAIGGILSTLAVLFYELDEPLMKKIEQELKERKEGSHES